MSSTTWTLTDVGRNLHESNFCITSESSPSKQTKTTSWQVSQTTLQGGLSQGVDLVEINNGKMKLFVIPTRGMGIWRAELEDGKSLSWKSPNRGPVHPSFVPLYDPSGIGWLEGFDELIVRCGLESNGAPDFDQQGKLLYPLHGRIANRPAYRVEVVVDEQARTLTLRGYVEESRFHFQKLRLISTITTSFDSTSFAINDQVENFGGTPAEMQMLYHINVGEPFLKPGSKLVAAVQNLEPRDSGTSLTENWKDFGPAVAGAAEDCFYVDLIADSHNETQVLLKNPDGSEGAAIRMNNQQLPCFAFWKNLVNGNDGYVTGLEPATNYPNPRSVESKAGRIIPLQPGETWSADITFDWLTNANEVSQRESTIDSLA